MSDAPRTSGRALLTLVAIGLLGLAAAALYQLSFYVRLPVDLLSFAESPFITDIVKLRLGEGLYTPPADNNSYPYTPGATLLTFGLASLIGKSDSIVALRTLQFGYVVATCFIGLWVVGQLQRRFLGPTERGERWLWAGIGAPVLLMVAFDPEFNLYTHSLHNDGLALLLSTLAFGLLVRFDNGPTRRLLVVMAVLPAAGFFVKQSLLIWLPLSTAWLLVSGHLRLRGAAVFALGGTAAVGVIVAACYALWGDPFIWWVFTALGAKVVSVLRSGQHLLEAGAYVALGLAAGWLLVLERPTRSGVALWGVWATLLLVQSYTSGAAWVSNHLGPGIFIATCWFLAAAPRLWRMCDTPSRTISLSRRVLVASFVVLLPGALDIVRLPRNPVPADFHRYVAEIEAAVEDVPTEDVLIGNGTWIYLRDGVLAKDRSSPVALHVGSNQPEIAREHLETTIQRISDGRYAMILTRELQSDVSAYDFQGRGSGVQDAIASAYTEVGRIPAVRGIERWWPKNLLAEVVVLVPR